MRKVCVLLILLSAFPLFAEEINIPADFNSIQAGIDASSNGDTIYVSPGTYYERIDFLGKSIFLSSLYFLFPDSSMIEETVITQHPDSTYNIVNFVSGEDSNAVLYGFTISDGERGVSIENNSNPIIDHNIIRGNVNMRVMVGGYAAGIQVLLSEPIIRFNIIENNSAIGALMDGAGGAGMGINVTDNQSPYIHTNIIRNNYCSAHTSSGGGISVGGNGSPIIENNRIYGNTSTNIGGGMLISASSNALIRNNLVYFNAARSIALEDGPRSNNGGGIAITNNATPTLENNLIKENYGGGIYVKESNPILGTMNSPNSIYNNFMTSGRDIRLEDSPEMVVFIDTLTFLNPDQRLLQPLDDFNLIINNGLFPDPVLSNDLYVHPAGNDLNSGTSESSPLRTINAATLRGPANPYDAVNIHLAPGTYDYDPDSRNYPACLWHNYHIKGDFPDNTIIDGGIDSSYAMPLFYAVELDTFSLQNLTLKDAYTGLFADNSSFSVDNCFVLNHYEAGIYNYHSNMRLTNSYISNRTRVPYVRSFGGVFMMYCSLPEIEVEISNNIFEFTLGTAIWVRRANPVIRNNIIRYNGAPGISLAGGIALREHSSSLIENNLIYGNYTNDTGAAIQAPFWHTEMTLNNNTIVNNYSYSNGSGAIYLSDYEGSSGILNNNIVYGNYNLEGSSQIVALTNDLNVNFCNIEGDRFGGTNYDLNPQFEDTLLYHLSSTSPCIDGGSNSYAFYDPSNPTDPDSALWPAQGTRRNDCGVYGGPYSQKLSTFWLDLITPNGSENLQIGSEYNITWNSNIAGDVKIELVSEQGNVVTLAENLENNGSFLWPISNNNYPGNYKIRITGQAHEFATDFSDRTFQLSWESAVNDAGQEVNRPEVFALENIYPSPFNSTAFVKIALAEQSVLRLTVYNVLGKEVFRSSDKNYPSGWHTIPLKADKLSSGTYFVNATVPGKMSQVRKVVLLK